MANEFNFDREPMMEMYIFESNMLLEQLEGIMLTVETEQKMNDEDINTIFRIMHTIKGSSAMMMFNGIMEIAHAVEDVFFIIRGDATIEFDYTKLCDIVLESADFIQDQIKKIIAGEALDQADEDLKNRIHDVVTDLQNENSVLSTKKEVVNQKFYITAAGNASKPAGSKYKIKVHFEEGCQMENIRAFSIIHNLKSICDELLHRPKDIINDLNSSEWIAENGFDIYLTTAESKDAVDQCIEDAIFVSSYSVEPMDEYLSETADLIETSQAKEIDFTLTDEIESNTSGKPIKQNMINVNLDKLDKLMDLVGEIVITESMVTQNPDLVGLQLNNFNKSVRQLRKLTDELQDIVMDIRMVPIAGIFQKMRRIVRDMSKGLNKEVELTLIGEETELDKSVIDLLSDPMIHLIRNSMDHGIEEAEYRESIGKSSKGSLKLEARNSGSDIVISIIDDGKGIDHAAVLDRAEERGLLTKSKEEMTEKEINELILLPGFSTKQEVTEFSGRGVGMDVVKKNIEKVGGIIYVDSQFGKGTAIRIKIPLTLAIINGMEVSVGASRYTVPIMSIKESFRPDLKDLVKHTSGNEMIMIRGNCYPIVRLHEFFKTRSNKINLEEGIIVVVENEKETFCIFVDELLGEQQVVVKPLPSYVSKYVGNVRGIGGCTIMGNGEMSLILDISGF